MLSAACKRVGNGEAAAKERAVIAAEMYKAGTPTVEIAKTLGVNRSAVTRYLENTGVVIAGKLTLPGVVSQKQLAKIVGGTIYSIKEAANTAGIKPIKIGRCLTYKESDIPAIEKAATTGITPEFRSIDPTYLAWAGGLFDGEGHVCLRITNCKKSKRGKTFTVNWEVANTDKSIMDRLSSVLSLLGVEHRFATFQKTVSGKSVWRIFVSSYRDVAMACKAIGPFCTGHKQKKMSVLFDWAMSMISFGCHRGEKFDLTCDYVRKIKEIR